MCKIYLLLILTLTVLAADSQLKKSQVEEFLKKIPNGLRGRTLQEAAEGPQLFEIVGSNPVPSVDRMVYNIMPLFVPNIGFVGQGYNIFYGNPKSTQSVDPGYRNINAIKHVYSSDYYQSISKDYRTFIPTGLQVSHNQACTISYTSKAISSLSQYKDSLSVSVGFSGGIGLASFSASADFKSVSESLSSSESLFIETSARCAQYTVTMKQDSNQSPPVGDAFNVALRELEALGENAEAYYDFFDEVGTHIVKEAQLGSTYGYIYQLSVTETKKLQSLNVNVEASASYMAATFKAKTAYEQQQENQLKSAVTDWRSYSTGAPPNKDNDVLQWSIQDVTNPMPIYIELDTISQFLKTYTSYGKLGVQEQTWNNLVSRLDKYYGSYCTGRLLKRGAVKTCENENIQAPISIGKPPVASFIDNFADGYTQVNFILKKSSKYLSKISNKPRATIERNFKQLYQKFLIFKANEDSLYYIKQLETGQCLTLMDCNSNSWGKYLVLANCSVRDICQRFKLTVANAQNQEVFISHEKLQTRPGGAFLVVDGYSESVGTFAVFWNDDNRVDDKTWRIAASM